MKGIFIIGILLITVVSCTKSKKEIVVENIKQHIRDKAFKDNVSNIDFMELDIIEMHKISGGDVEYAKLIGPLVQELKELTTEGQEKNRKLERIGEGMNMFNVAAKQLEIEYIKEDQEKLIAQMKQLNVKIDSIEKAIDTRIYDSIYDSKVFMKAVFTYNDGHKENMMDTIYNILINKEYEVIP